MVSSVYSGPGSSPNDVTSTYVRIWISYNMVTVREPFRSPVPLFPPNPPAQVRIPAPAPGATSSGTSKYSLHASLLYDPDTKSFLTDQSIQIDPHTGLITKVSASSPNLLPSTSDLDLRGLTILPGFIDAHTHIFLHSYREATSLVQERDESPIERTIRATNHLRLALKAGYTTYRDLGTEGVYDADTHVRNAVNRGLIPGPRLFVTTEALASSGSYAIRYESGGQLGVTQVGRISDPCDGVDGVRAGVRRRIAAGADLVKFYSDYRRRTLRFPGPNGPGQPDIIFPPGMLSIPLDFGMRP
jgi:hypothetical protein